MKNLIRQAVICYYCNVIEIDMESDNEEDFLSRLKFEGWKVINKKSYCDKCYDRKSIK